MKTGLPNDFFSEASDADERDYAVTTFTDGKWYAVSPKSILLRMTAMAILEKIRRVPDNSPTQREIIVCKSGLFRSRFPYPTYQFFQLILSIITTKPMMC